MNWTMVCNRRGAWWRRVSEMGGKGSRSEPTSNASLPIRTMPTPCRVQAPEPVHVWSENSCRWTKRYDVYICSSEHDIEYAKALLTYLQEQPENLRCFLPLRDMNPGGAIPTEMTESAENSHCWIMLLTSNSISDEWCQFQMHQFLALAPHGNGRLIPVMVKLPFQYYPKELRYMFAFKDPLGDQKVFDQLRRSIVSHLAQLPTADRDPREETDSSTSEGLSSSRQGITSQVMSSPTQESTSTTSARSSAVQGSADDASLRSSLSQESTDIVSVNSDGSQEANKDTSLNTSLIEEPTRNASTISTLMETSMTQMSNKCLMNEETTEASQQKPYTMGNASDLSGNSSFNQALVSNVSGRTSIASNMTITGMQVGNSIVQESTTETFLRSGSTKQSVESSLTNYEAQVSKASITSDMPSTGIQELSPDMFVGNSIVQESTTETSFKLESSKPSMDPLLMNYETQVSNANALTITLDSNSSTTITSDMPSTGMQVGNSIVQESTTETSLRPGSTKSNMDPSLTNYEAQVSNASITSDIPSTGIQVLSPDMFVGNSIVQESTTETSLRPGSTKSNMDPSLTNYETQVSNALTITLDSNLSTTTVNNESCKEEEIMNLPFQNVQSDIYTSFSRTPTKNNGSTGLQSDMYTSCGATLVNKNPEDLQGDIYTSCSGANADSPDLQGDLYTSCGGKADQPFCSLKSNIYTSFGGTRTEDKDLGWNLFTYTGSQDVMIDTPSLTINIYSNTDRDIEIQSQQEDRYTSCGKMEANPGDPDVPQEDLYASCSGNHTKDFLRHQSDVSISCGGKQVHREFPTLQTHMYTNAKENQLEKKTSCRFQSDLYTSCSGTQCESTNAQDLQGEKAMTCSAQGLLGEKATSSSAQGLQGQKGMSVGTQGLQGQNGMSVGAQDLQGGKAMTSKGLQLDKGTSFGRLQGSNKLSESLQSNIYTSLNGRLTMRKEFWAACGEPTTQTMDQHQHNLHPGFTDSKVNDEDSGNSSINLYTSCSGGKASAADSCQCHGNIYMSCSCTQALTQLTINRHRDDSGRPASEAADKT